MAFGVDGLNDKEEEEWDRGSMALGVQGLNGTREKDGERKHGRTFGTWDRYLDEDLELPIIT